MYDVVIVGCGPAGLTAGLYLARANKKVVILEKETIGGQMSTSPLIENYPGYKAISGSELSNNMYEQATDAGCEIVIDEALKVEKNRVIGEDGVYEGKVIILATGAKYRKLGIPKEEDFIGSGIHFCTACDGMFYKNKEVCVIGGANSAVVNALYLSDICKKVYLIYRKDKLKCEDVLLKQIENKENVEILYNSEVDSIIGEDEFEGIILKDGRELKLDGMFESIGMLPETKVASDLLDLEEDNYFKNDVTRTKYPNVFVIGDCISKKVRQVATAVNDGAIAATFAINYLNEQN